MKKRTVAMAAAMALMGTVPVTSTSAATTPKAHASKAPNVRCVQLDIAERKLRRLGYRIRERGGGLFGIIVKADWVVVHQSQRGNTVTLTAGRYC
jgi:hypothetical protein